MAEPGRATLDLAVAVAAAPLVARRPASPRNVVLVPGLEGGPWNTWPLQAYLRAQGHHVVSPGWLRNIGSLSAVRGRWNDLVVAEAHHRGPLTVIGWSVGGCIARQVAYDHPEAVDEVVTLGAPLTPGWFPDRAAARRAIPAPCTAVYSRSDGIFAWRDCVQPAGPGVTNHEVVSSHLGMAANAMVFDLISLRLAGAGPTSR